MRRILLVFVRLACQGIVSNELLALYDRLRPKIQDFAVSGFVSHSVRNEAWWSLLDDVRTFFEQNPEDFAD